MATLLLVKINRIVNLIALIYGVVQICTIPPLPNVPRSVAGPAKFFTNWNVVIQIIFYSCCIYQDHFSKIKFDLRKQTKRGLYFHGIVFPAAFIVFTTFWSLMWFDRDLIFPKKLEKYLLPHVNHIIHTMILIGMLIEATFHYHPLPKAKTGLTVMYGILGLYLGWMIYLGVTYNVWVYPFINQMPNFLKPVFFSVMAVGGLILYKLGEKYHKLIWKNGNKTGKQKVSA
jgi:hypothetical protein